MKLECPYAHFIEDIPFELTYSRKDKGSLLKLAGQLPKMWLQLYREHRLIKKLVAKYHINLIISDSRYGLYHHQIPCIFITHQLQIKVPIGGGFVNFLNHYFIEKFNACWVPDFENESKALAGELSRKNKLNNVHYIGPLSRAELIQDKLNNNAPVLYLLSGVEPQRSILEQLILKHHSSHPHQAILIRGSRYTKEKINPKFNLTVYDLCNAGQLQNLVSASKYVVCRSGYSSIMDLVKWQKNAVLIPTPGQYEQEYLAEYVSQKKWFLSIKQNEFNGIHEEHMKGYQCPVIQPQEMNFEQLINDIL